jgi:hypothetical protein
MHEYKRIWYGSQNLELMSCKIPQFAINMKEINNKTFEPLGYEVQCMYEVCLELLNHNVQRLHRIM